MDRKVITSLINSAREIEELKAILSTRRTVNLSDEDIATIISAMRLVANYFSKPNNKTEVERVISVIERQVAHMPLP